MMLDVALSYAARGWRVFPLHSVDSERKCSCGVADCSDAGKHPRARRGVKEATTDEARIREWFGPDAPPSNIAIATGEQSGITVLDIDIGEGKGGAETWAELTREHGEPQTLMARTGSGGMHVFFLYNSALKTSSNTLGKGVDCRNDGGYVVAPPSRHRSGGCYAWENDLPLAAMPAHLSQRKETRGRPRKDDPTRRKYTIEEVRQMLEHVPADDRDMWRHVGVILGREFARADEAWAAYVEWSDKWDGAKGRNHEEIMREAFYEISQQTGELSLGTIIKAAINGGWSPKAGEVPVSHFVYYGPGNNFIYRPTASMWISEGVNAACSPVNERGTLVKPADWLRANMLATSMTNDPSLEEDYVKGVDCRDGVLFVLEGAATFNTYRPPTIEHGDARLAAPFVRHVQRVFSKPGDADQFLDYMAHRVQRPAEKPRFALLIAGDQGVGKDTAIEFCAPAFGHWNMANIEPGDMDTNFNEYAASVLVRVSEAANLHDMNKWAFNERMKVLIAGTPDHVTINPKYGQKYSVRLHCGVVLTTNHMLSGIYIPQDDRRYDVIEAATKAEMGIAEDAVAREYFSELWDWFLEGGDAHIAAFLAERDISRFSASNGQRKTNAHKLVVSVNTASDHWLLDVLDELGEPSAVRSDTIAAGALKRDMSIKEVAARMQASMSRAGYRVHRNPQRGDGRWKYEGKLASVFVKQSLSLEEAENARQGLTAPF